MPTRVSAHTHMLASRGWAIWDERCMLRKTPSAAMDCPGMR